MTENRGPILGNLPDLLRRLYLFVLILLSAAVLTSVETASAYADVCRPMAPNHGAGDVRVAIVIGNGAYGHGLPALPNPPHDATAVAAALAGLGFEVFLIKDASDEAMRDCLTRAYGRMSHAAVGLFYYSGHGIQVDDENYLVAVDARAGDLKTGFVAVQPIVDEIQHRAATTLVFLDACRNNPLTRNGPRGLSVSLGRNIQVVANRPPPPGASTPQVHGLMVAYSTSPDAVALDGDGELSPFSDAFVRKIAIPGYSIQRVMSEVTESVGEQTKWAQTPWMKSSLTSELKLAGGQTLEEAQAVSENWANASLKLLWTSEGRDVALAAALKGLPAHPSEATLGLFSKAYLAVYSAMQADMSKLPVQGWASGDIASSDLVAVVHRLDTGCSRLELWSRTRKVLLRSLSVYPADVFYAAQFNPDGTSLVSYGEGKVLGWDVATGNKLFETVVAHDPVGGLLGNKKLVFSVGFSPDGKFLYVTASDKNRVQILDARTGRVVQSLQSNDFPGVPDVNLAPSAGFMNKDELCLVLGSTREAQTAVVGTYDLAKHQFHLIDRVPSKAVMYFSCDRAGRYIALTLLETNGQPGFVVWDVESGKKVVSVSDMVMNTSFDPKEPFVVTSAGSETKVYDLTTGTETHLPAIPRGFRAMPNGVFSSVGLASPLALSKSWFSWELPDGPALVDKALSMLSLEEQADVARQRISFVAAD